VLSFAISINIFLDNGKASASRQAEDAALKNPNFARRNDHGLDAWLLSPENGIDSAIRSFEEE
jgi:hypothetical protein